MGKATKFELTFLKKEKVAEKTFSFYFDRKNLDFDYDPGQYLKLRLEIENPDDRGTSRYFTISSSSTDKDFLTITTRIIQSSFKLKLNNLEPGEKISAFGPIGYFDFDPKGGDDNIFLAGGIGITPYHSILRYIDAKKLYTKITLFVSFSYQEEAVFFDELKEIEKRRPSVKIVYTLTKEKERAGFENGRIDEDLIKRFAPGFKKSKFFITGPEAMVNSMSDLVLGMGISEESIFKEDFPGY